GGSSLGLEPPRVMHLYVDESGTRHPDHSPGRRRAHDHDWFAMGGVLLRQQDESTARQHHAQFTERWRLDPDTDLLHSNEIRNKTGCFTWLTTLTPTERDRVRWGGQSQRALCRAGACAQDRPDGQLRYHQSCLLRRNDNGDNVRAGVRRNGSHHRVYEPAERPARRGQRGRLAFVIGAAVS